MTTKTIDHVAWANQRLDVTEGATWLEPNAALIHATLALVEEQRTANLIARAALSVAVDANGGRITAALADVVDVIDARLGLGGVS